MENFSEWFSFLGRASVSPILDLFITLLSMGVSKWQQLLKQREVGTILVTFPCFDRSHGCL